MHLMSNLSTNSPYQRCAKFSDQFGDEFREFPKYVNQKIKGIIEFGDKSSENFTIHRHSSHIKKYAIKICEGSTENLTTQ